MRNHTETGASRVALVGVLAALSLIALYLSAVSPTARMGIVAIAGLFPAGAVVSAGLKAGFFCYGAAGLRAYCCGAFQGNACSPVLLWPLAHVSGLSAFPPGRWSGCASWRYSTPF